jgi:hypothetical protein
MQRDKEPGKKRKYQGQLDDTDIDHASGSKASIRSSGLWTSRRTSVCVRNVPHASAAQNGQFIPPISPQNFATFCVKIWTARNTICPWKILQFSKITAFSSGQNAFCGNYRFFFRSKRSFGPPKLRKK